MNSKLTLNAVAAAAALFFAADAGAQAKSDVKADPGSSCATAAVAEGADSDAPAEPSHPAAGKKSQAAGQANVVFRK